MKIINLFLCTLVLLTLASCKPKHVKIEGLPSAAGKMDYAVKGDKMGLYSGYNDQRIILEPEYDNVQWVDSIAAFIATKGNDKFFVSCNEVSQPFVVPYKSHQRLDDWDLRIVCPDDSVYFYDNYPAYEGLLHGPYTDFIYTEEGEVYPQKGDLYGLLGKQDDYDHRIGSLPVEFKQIYEIWVDQKPTNHDCYMKSWKTASYQLIRVVLAEDASGHWMLFDNDSNQIAGGLPIDAEKLVNAPLQPQRFETALNQFDISNGDIFIQSASMVPGSDNRLRTYAISLILDEPVWVDQLPIMLRATMK